MVIYKTLHLTTGKFYIGRDKNNSPKYFGSGTDIKSIIKDEGKVNLKKIILEECKEKELSSREEYWLNYYDAENNPMCYNRTNKAYGCSRQTEVGKKRISESLKGKKRSNKSRENLSKGRLGKKRIQLKERSDKGKLRGKNKLLSFNAKNRNREHQYKPVLQYNLNMELIKKYKSAAQAKEETGLKIQNALTGRAETCGEYIWLYQE